MKKIIMIMVAMLTLFAGTAFADWQVTVSWNKSTSGALVNEKLFVGNTEICNVAKGKATSCTFTRTAAQCTGQKITVVSYGANQEAKYEIGLLNAPASVLTPANGGTIMFRWVQ